jgi:hypothetical protein
MALVDSKVTVVKIGSTDISQYTTSSEISRKADSHDVTTYGKSAHVYQGGLLDGTFKLDGLYDSTATTGPRALLEPLLGTTVTFTRRPEGTGAGLPQDVGSAVVTSYSESSPVADMVKWSCELQLSDTVTTTAQ